MTSDVAYNTTAAQGISEIYDKDHTLKKLARLSISSEGSDDYYNDEDEAEMRTFCQEKSSTLSSRAGSHSSPVLLSSTHTRSSSNATLLTSTTTVASSAAIASSAGGVQKNSTNLTKKGELISFYAKRRDQMKQQQSKFSSVSPLDKSQTERQQVVLLETSDSDFFYSLSAKDKFGRMFEMSELNDKVVLVKLNAKDQPQPQPQSQSKPQTIQEIEQAPVTEPKKKITPYTNNRIVEVKDKSPKKAKSPSIELPKQEDPNLLYSLHAIDQFGKKFEMSQLRGKVVLIVNTASKCKMAKQFTALQELHEKYHDQGLAILAFPTSQFGHNQELKTDGEILQFCKTMFGVKFPMMKLAKVNGEGEEKIYTYLKNYKRKYFGLKKITWNFEKFLIDRDGKIVKRAPSFIKPQKLESQIKELLKENKKKN